MCRFDVAFAGLRRRLLGAPVLAALAGALVLGIVGAPHSRAQSAAPVPAAFEIADIHKSGHSTFPIFQGDELHGDRYVMKNASMIDLISTAYGVDPDKVLSGPSWIEVDRFDVIAKAPPASSPEALKVMLQALLADRFKLVVHTDTKPLSVFGLTVGKGGKPKLKASDGSGDSGCGPQRQDPTPDGINYIVLSCHNVTMEAFAESLRNFAGNYISARVVDLTGLKGTWDFDIKWNRPAQLAQLGGDGITPFDAVDKQLGLKLEPQKIPMPVLLVDSVNEKPTDNPPGIETKLPPPPPTEFEVAVIKPSAPGENPGGRILPSGQVDLQATTLKNLITLAWNLNPRDTQSLVGAPKWMDSDKFDITAKPPSSGDAEPDFDDIRLMMQALLIDRFQMKIHMEDRPVDGYTLIAANPKMKKADPTNRTGCKNGPGPDGKDPRITNPILSRLISCQNVTMAQFADQLQNLAPGYFYNPILDATGLEGAWDFTLSFSPIAAVIGGGGGGAVGRGGVAPAAPAPASGSGMAPEPSGALSLFDAVSKQLGLKLEMRKRPMPVLVIDHVEEKPTDN